MTHTPAGTSDRPAVPGSGATRTCRPAGGVQEH